MKNIKYLLIALCAIVMTSSCSSKKKLTKTDTDNIVPIETIKNQKARFDQIVGNMTDFNLFQARTKYSLGNKSLSGRLNIEHGKRMKLTATVLGIEVIRLDINREQVTIVDKFDKLYTVLSIDELAQKLGLQEEMRYDAIESLIMGRMFIPGKTVTKSGDFKSVTWTTLPTGEMIGDFIKDKYVLNYVFDNNNNLQVTAVRLNDTADPFTVSYEYEDYQQISNIIFPGNSTVRVITDDSNIQVGISMSNPTEGKTWTAFVPNGEYRQVTISDLIDAIENLSK